jgi:hypothetical protein
MKITTDFTQVVPGRGSALRTSLLGSPAPRTPEVRNAAAQAGGSRGMTEALSIAQMAQVVVQKAMEISSRLKSMAMDAMTTNKVNFDELKNIGAQLQSSLGAYSGRFDTVIIPPAVQVRTPRADASLRDDFTILSEQASRLAGNRAADTGALARVAVSIEQKSRAIDEAVQSLAARAGMSRLSEESAPRETARAAAGIVQNFESALKAQGNISRENAAVLLRD